MHSLSADGKSRVPVWTLGDRLRKAREHAGHPRQQDLADRLHVSRSAVAAWENGVHVPSYLALYRWAEITDVPLDWLLDGDDDRGPDVGVSQPACKHLRPVHTARLTLAA